MVTEVPSTPDVGFRLVMLGGITVTVKLTPALANPPTVTTTFPVVAPVGTVTTALVALQLVAVAVVPLNLTVLVPCVAPKFVPAIVTEAPTNPEVGFKFVMAGVAAPPPVFEGLADWTKPEHPAKVILATARTQRTTMHKRVFCEFVAERIVIINIFFYPRVRRRHPRCGRARPHASQGYGQTLKRETGHAARKRSGVSYDPALSSRASLDVRPVLSSQELRSGCLEGTEIKRFIRTVAMRGDRAGPGGYPLCK